MCISSRRTILLLHPIKLRLNKLVKNATTFNNNNYSRMTANFETRPIINAKIAKFLVSLERPIIDQSSVIQTLSLVVFPVSDNIN